VRRRVGRQTPSRPSRGSLYRLIRRPASAEIVGDDVAKEPAEVTAADVFAFLAEQRAPRRGEKVVRIEDGEAGLAARTIARRLSSVAGLFEYLLARGDAGRVSNPVPRGLASRRPGRRGRGGVRLVRTPRTLPRVLSPPKVDALLGARCGHGAIERWCWRCCSAVCAAARCSGCVSGRFFGALGEYLELERPADLSTMSRWAASVRNSGGAGPLPRGQKLTVDAQPLE
jgi:integrase